jgi:hypothetical protein
MDASISKITTENHTPKVETTSFLHISQELRLKVYSHVLAPDLSNHAPALLEVLGKSQYYSNDYQEALELYKEINFYVDTQTIDKFKNLRFQEMLKLRHFKMRWCHR